jgi:hypothetical protein
VRDDTRRCGPRFVDALRGGPRASRGLGSSATLELVVTHLFAHDQRIRDDLLSPLRRHSLQPFFTMWPSPWIWEDELAGDAANVFNAFGRAG